MLWRVRLLLDLKGSPPEYQMALDEALLELRSSGLIEVDTFRLYVFNPSSITIGYFQRIGETVNLEEAEKLGVPIVRRVSGGGAVYHDVKGEVTYSIIASASGRLSSVEESYKIICGGIVRALEILGVNASFQPINDVVVGGRKISGSAQARRRGALLQHGTLMYDTDIETMEKLLRPPREKMESKGVSSLRERVVTVSEVLGRKTTLEEVVEAMIKGFSQALGLSVEEGTLSEREERLAEELTEKYRSKEWNFMR